MNENHFLFECLHSLHKMYPVCIHVLNEATLLKYGVAWYATMNDGFCDVLNNLCQWHNVFPLTKCKIWWAVKICLCWRLFWSDIGFKDKGYNIWTNYYFKGSFRYVTVCESYIKYMYLWSQCCKVCHIQKWFVPEFLFKKKPNNQGYSSYKSFACLVYKSEVFALAA